MTIATTAPVQFTLYPMAIGSQHMTATRGGYLSTLKAGGLDMNHNNGGPTLGPLYTAIGFVVFWGGLFYWLAG